MAHPRGERLQCEECGAEIVYVVACHCPAAEESTHADICCSKQMRSLGVDKSWAPPGQIAG